MGQSDYRLGAGAAVRLNSDEVMQVLRLGSSQDFICDGQDLVFDAFIYSEPVRRV